MNCEDGTVLESRSFVWQRVDSKFDSRSPFRVWVTVVRLV